MIQRGKEKNEGSYLSYIKQLYAYIPLAFIKTLKLNSLLGEFEQEILKLPNPIRRFQILNKIYIACRCIDDVIDGDTPKALPPEDIRDYAATSEEHLRKQSWNKDFTPDIYFSKAFDSCRKISIEIREQILAVVESMKFDAERRSKFLESEEIEFIPEEELKIHYYQLDIEGTIGAMLTLINEENTPKNREIIQPLGEVMRIYYDIRDLSKETRQGLINIPIEEAQRFRITKEMLTDWAHSGKSLKEAPEEILYWAQVKMQEAKKLLQEFRKNLEHSGFKKLTRLFFEKQYISHYEEFKKSHPYLFKTYSHDAVSTY